MKLSCFKAYDVRGKVPEELDELLAYHIGRALAQVLNPGAVVVGRDVRLSSPELAAISLPRGLWIPAWTCWISGYAGRSRSISPPPTLARGGRPAE